MTCCSCCRRAVCRRRGRGCGWQRLAPHPWTTAQGGEVFFFTRRCSSVHEQEPEAIEPDTLSAVGVGTDDIVCQFDVREQRDGLPSRVIAGRSRWRRSSATRDARRRGAPGGSQHHHCNRRVRTMLRRRRAPGAHRVAGGGGSHARRPLPMPRLARENAVTSVHRSR